MRDRDEYETSIWARRFFAFVWIAPIVISLWVTAGVHQFIIGWLSIGTLISLGWIAIDNWHRKNVENGWVDPIHREDNPYRWKEDQ